MGSNPSFPSPGVQGLETHQLYGLHKRVKGQKQQIVIQIYRSLSNQYYLKWAQSIKQMKEFDKQGIFIVPTSMHFEQSPWYECTSEGTMTANYDSNQKSIFLSQQIKRRKLKQYGFEEIQIWFLLFQILKGSARFEKFDRKIGDIHPKNILITQEGEVKIIAVDSFPNQLNNFQSFVRDKSTPVFLAPEQLKQEYVMTGEYPSKINPCKAEVFSIGVTILLLGVLENIEQLYKEQGFNMDKYHEFLKKFSGNFTPQLFEILEKMLEINPDLRLSSSFLLQKVKIYESNILNYEPVSEWKFK